MIKQFFCSFVSGEGGSLQTELMQDDRTFIWRPNEEESSSEEVTRSADRLLLSQLGLCVNPIKQIVFFNLL